MAKTNSKVGKAKPAPAKKSAKKAAKKSGSVKLGDPEDTMEFIVEQYAELTNQFDEFKNGKKVAVSRTRKAAGELRKALGNLRKEIQAAKGSM
jgi:hypothetical protein